MKQTQGGQLEEACKLHFMQIGKRPEQEQQRRTPNITAPAGEIAMKAERENDKRWRINNNNKNNDNDNDNHNNDSKLIIIIIIKLEWLVIISKSSCDESKSLSKGQKRPWLLSNNREYRNKANKTNIRQK